MKHHECPNDFDPTRSYRDGVIQDVPARHIVEHHGNVYIYCFNSTTGRMGWANCHPAARHLNGGFGVRWWMDGHEVTSLGRLLMDREDAINSTGMDRITVTIDVDTTKVRTRAIEDALVEILSQWEADDRIVTCDLCVDAIKKENEPCQ